MFRVFLISVTLTICLTGAAVAQEAQKQEAGGKSAEHWLFVVDQEGYGASWEEGSYFLKTAVTRSDWIKLLSATRKPLGKMISRKVHVIQYTREIPGAPDGEYVVIQFDTVFENKRNTLETLTVKLDKDGKWHVSGYFIK